jgi:hypothetical protein
MISLVLYPNGLILFPFSWKKYPKRAAAEDKKLKTAFVR